MHTSRAPFCQKTW